MELFVHEQKHLELLKDHLSECTVLLKKDGSFPLTEPGKIAAFGNGVRRTIKGGTGSGEVNSRFFVNVEEGLERCGFTLTSKRWLDAYNEIYRKARRDFHNEIVAKAKREKVMAVMMAMGAIMKEPEYDLELDGDGDCAIYVLARISGEGSDRSYEKGDILLTDSEVRDILALNERFEKFMLVLNTGGPVDLSPVNEVKNILVLSQLGVETGEVLGKLLLGQAVPSGKLTTTWAARDAYPDQDFGDLDTTRYKEGVYVGYRYFDSFGIEPLYPFGHGLSYTDFTITTKDVKVEGTKVTVTAEVKNIGNYAGKETVQVYVSLPEGRLDHPYQELAAFQKTGLLEKGQKQTLELSFDLKDLCDYDEENERYFLEKGKYLIRVGSSSRNNETVKAIELCEEYSIRQVRSAIGVPDFKDLVPATRPEESNVDTITLKSLDIEEETVDYDREDKIAPAVEKLSDTELTLLSMGRFDPKGGLASMIGNASMSVAGAAGETARVRNADFPVVVMADGPAGVRIASKAYRDGDGARAITAASIATVEEYLPLPIKLLMKLIAKRPGKNAEVFEQYTTAIPIGTAIAQSFNTEFAKLCGDIVGTEMQIYGVQLWLAPALNIHRDIRCGRNFEYYSEDPLVSGKMASALTKGVQAHEGCGVTIKHYCANNQETNRTGSDSVMSERTLRQIYIKGFEICIKESGPLALMTSYNLINGTHTSESYKLVSDILYREFGFEGLVMTDWVIDHGQLNKKSRNQGAYSYNVLAAGGTLFMPGSKKDYAELLEGYSQGKVSRKQLQKNVTRLYELIRKLKI